jgi:hypothetical protein
MSQTLLEFIPDDPHPHSYRWAIRPPLSRPSEWLIRAIH